LHQDNNRRNCCTLQSLHITTVAHKVAACCTFPFHNISSINNNNQHYANANNRQHFDMFPSKHTPMGPRAQDSLEQYNKLIHVNVRRNSRSVRKDIRGDQSPLHLPEPQDFKKKMAHNTTTVKGFTGGVKCKEEGERNRGPDLPRRSSSMRPSKPSVQVPGGKNLKSKKKKGNGKPSQGAPPQTKNSKKRQVPHNKMQESFPAAPSVNTTQTHTPTQKTLQGYEREREVGETSQPPHEATPDTSQKGHAA